MASPSTLTELSHMIALAKGTIANVAQTEAWQVLVHCICPFFLLGIHLPRGEEAWAGLLEARMRPSTSPSKPAKGVKPTS